jgi:hypothetical protein
MFPTLVEFNLINDYDKIPIGHDNPNIGYHEAEVGKMKVIGFVDESSMYKVQVVCKVHDPETGLTEVDHILELIIPIPEAGGEYNPLGEGRKRRSHNVIKFLTKNVSRKSSPYLIFPSKSKSKSKSKSRSKSKSKSRSKLTSSMIVEPRESLTELDNTYNVQTYSALVNDNIKAYLERSDTKYLNKYKNVSHKYINHVARLFYLYELMYQYPSLKTEPLTPFQTISELRNNPLRDFFYYKYVYNNSRNSTRVKKIGIKIPIQMLLNAYQKILKTDQVFSRFINKNPEWYNRNASEEEMEHNHDKFLALLFDPNVFVTRSEPKLKYIQPKVTYKAPSKPRHGKTRKIGSR